MTAGQSAPPASILPSGTPNRAGGMVPLRWVRANADGILLNHPGRIYCVRLVGLASGQTEISAVLRDGTTVTDPILLAMDVVAGVPDDWPNLPVTMNFLRGLYVTFTGGTAAVRLLIVGWESD